MILVALILFGLILGSFVNALVWRLHEGRDWVRERSECTHCHHTLAPKDLIPVVSWLMLRGKCRYCGKRIEDNPLAELAVPTLFAVSYIFWPHGFESEGVFLFGVWLVFLVAFVALAIYDLRWFLLPNKMVFPLIGLAAYQLIMQAFVFDGGLRVIGIGLAGAAVVAGLFYAIFQISRGTWIGGGDVKLGIVLGLLAGGVVKGFLLLFLASLAGILFSLPMLLTGKAKAQTHVPFGPFLIIGLIVVYLFGSDIVAWYEGLLYV
jgi:prepilin signal peptidase PulO-like enzyme (type II secretory pathway)